MEPSYFGILIRYQKRVFIEMIPLRNNALLLTIFDLLSDSYKTHVIDESSDVMAVKAMVQGMYYNIAPQPQQI